MKSILSMLIMCNGLFAFGSVRELGTVCAVDCRYQLPTPRAVVVGEMQWSGDELEQYYNARVSAKAACEATRGKIPEYAEPKPFSGYNGYVCCALEKIDGVITPSTCTLLNNN